MSGRIIGQNGPTKAERDVRNEVLDRSIKAGEWIDEHTTPRPIPSNIFDRLPKCLTRDEDGNLHTKRTEQVQKACERAKNTGNRKDLREYLKQRGER